MSEREWEGLVGCGNWMRERKGGVAGWMREWDENERRGKC